MKISWKYSVAAGILLIPFVLSMGFIFPAGDDFARCNMASRLFDVTGGLHEMGSAWWKWSGRYTHHFLVVFLGRVVLSREACALTAAGMALLHLVPLYGIFSTLQGGRRRESVFLALFCLLAIYCGYQDLSESFYFITGIFSIGVSGGMTLLFLWAMCRLWFAPQVTRGTVFFPVISGILAIGCYEHSALATLLAAGIALGMARLYRHPHEAAFRQVMLWIGAFFLLSFLCRGNFRRQTKRGTDIHVISDQLGNAWDDWLMYGFWVFASVLPVAAVVAGGLARPRWRASLADKLSIPVVMSLGGAAYVLLSASIVFVHALSDVTIGQTSKLPASLALLAAYLLAFLVLACGDGLRRKLSALPAWLVIPPLFVVVCTAPNMCRTVANLLTGENAVYAAALEDRFAWFRSSEARDEKPVLVADLGVAPFLFVSEAVQTRTTLWPNKHIAEMFDLPGGVCRVSLNAKTALAAVERAQPANLGIEFSRERERERERERGAGSVASSGGEAAEAGSGRGGRTKPYICS